MKVFLTSAYPFSATENFGPQWLRQHADAGGLALLAEHPSAADCVLFVENHPGHDPYFFEVLRSDLYRRYRSKCVLYHDADRSVTLLPTISPSLERWQMGHGAKKSVHYVARLCENAAVNAATPVWSANRPYLYSFVGSSRTHALRKRLLEQSRPGTFLLDTGQQRAWEMTAAQKLDYEREYLRVTVGSDFVLCPRGIGPCTYRLFETMQLGRAPVIISDQWVEVDGIDWNACSIRVKEKDVGRLDAILHDRRHEARDMGRRARVAWERHFSPQVSLSRLAHAACAVLDRPYRSMQRLSDQCQFINGYHFRGLLRYYRNRLQVGRAN
jgi:hypothetical protein